MKEYTMNPECLSEPCPVETTLNIISGKWKGIILFRLLGGKKRFNELQKIMPTITTHTLTLQLRQLEQDGIVKRTVYAEVPPRVDYELTPLGTSMKHIIQAVYEWGVDYQNLKDS
jgi:DNA-binding HxlR family transcriptional regulator